MRCRVAQGIDLVAALGKDFAIPDDNAADRVAARPQVAFTGLIDGAAHIVIISHGQVIVQLG